jgi:DNA primase catalytic subunit
MKYISTFELFEGYNKPRDGGKRRWSVKYKKKINCSNPKGFSQIQYCKRKRRGGHYKTESVLFESSDESQSEEIKSYLSQIFLELEDDGYDIDIEGRWMKTYNTAFGFPDSLKELTGFKIKIGDKGAKEDILPAIEAAINYMSDEGFSNYWIILDNFGKLNFEELKNYFNVSTSLVNLPERTLELNFHK